MSLSNLQHTNIVGECQANQIQGLAADFDNYWYISVDYIIKDHKDLQQDWDNECERVERRLEHLSKYVERLKTLGDEVTCPACFAEVVKQIGRQTKDIDDLKQEWGL
jgi:hypothetical protein